MVPTLHVFPVEKRELSVTGGETTGGGVMATKKWVNMRSDVVAELGCDVLAEARQHTDN